MQTVRSAVRRERKQQRALARVRGQAPAQQLRSEGPTAQRVAGWRGLREAARRAQRQLAQLQLHPPRVPGEQAARLGGAAEGCHPARWRPAELGKQGQDGGASSLAGRLQARRARLGPEPGHLREGGARLHGALRAANGHA